MLTDTDVVIRKYKTELGFEGTDLQAFLPDTLAVAAASPHFDRFGTSKFSRNVFYESIIYRVDEHRIVMGINSQESNSTEL